MPKLRRVVQTRVAAWSAGMAVKLLGWIVPMSSGLQGALALAALVIGAILGWHASRHVTPWTPKDLRDGAVGYGIVAVLVLPMVAAVLAELAGTTWIAPAAVATAVIVLAAATYVHRHANDLGVPEPDGPEVLA